MILVAPGEIPSSHDPATRREPEVCARWRALLIVADLQASTSPRVWPVTVDPWCATPGSVNHGLLDDIQQVRKPF